MRSRFRRDRLLGAVLWRRLDRPAMEICRLWRGARSFRLEGVVLIHEGGPAEVTYEVLCDAHWRTRAARVELGRGSELRKVEIRRDGRDRWRHDGDRAADLDGATDVDLGFTPATNTLPIRRLALEVGASAAVDAAWVRFPELSLERLPQRYTRSGPGGYLYESAGGAFRAALEVDGDGLVVRYGDYWERAGDPGSGGEAATGA